MTDPLHTAQVGATAAFAVLTLTAAVLGWCGLDSEAFAFFVGGFVSLGVAILAGFISAWGER